MTYTVTTTNLGGLSADNVALSFFLPAGVTFLKRALKPFAVAENVDLVIANAENASSGMGMTPSAYRQIREAGVDLVEQRDVRDVAPRVGHVARHGPADAPERFPVGVAVRLLRRIVLRTIARCRDACLGVYGTTVRPGRVAVGDPVVVAAGPKILRG